MELERADAKNTHWTEDTHAIISRVVLAGATLTGMAAWSPGPALGIGVGTYLLVRWERWIRSRPRVILDAEYADLSGPLELSLPPLPPPPPIDPAVLRDLVAAENDVVDQRLALQATMREGVVGGAVLTYNAEYRARIEEWFEAGLDSRAPMMAVGPSGVGKSAIVRAFYRLLVEAKLVTGDLVTANVATFADQFGLDDMFGHAKGPSPAPTTRARGS